MSASIERDRPDSRHSSKIDIVREEEETQVHDEEDELFGDFKFRSFKTHKQMEEDYQLLELEDPEEP